MRARQLVTEEDIAEVVTPVFAVLRILALDNPQARRKLKKTVGCLLCSDL